MQFCFLQEIGKQRISLTDVLERTNQEIRRKSMGTGVLLGSSLI
jgi:hypothetical protein